MKQRILGRTGWKVSEVGLGCEHLQGQSAQAVKAVVDAALAEGINILDVFMSEPNVRSDLGQALKGRRNQVLLQGHLGAAWLDDQYCRTRQMNHVRHFFEDFLQRLGTDYLDIGMLHFVDTQADFDQVFGGEMIDYACQLKKEGLIGAVGMSSHDPAAALKAVKTGKIDVLMFSINPAFDLAPESATLDDLFAFQTQGLEGTNPLRAKLYETCEAMGTAITVMKPLGAGVLLSAERSPFGAALTPVQCIHYALTRPAVASVLVGCRTPQEVHAAAAYEDASQEERDYAAVLSKSAPYSLQGRCMYCNHCLPCPARIDIAQVNKYLDLALLGQPVPETVTAHYLALEAHGSDCIGCGSCEDNCPFAVPVRERMEKAARIFGR